MTLSIPRKRETELNTATCEPRNGFFFEFTGRQWLLTSLATGCQYTCEEATVASHDGQVCRVRAVWGIPGDQVERMPQADRQALFRRDVKTRGGTILSLLPNGKIRRYRHST